MGAKKKIIKRLKWLKDDSERYRETDEWERAYYNAMGQAIGVINEEWPNPLTREARIIHRLTIVSDVWKNSTRGYEHGYYNAMRLAIDIVTDELNKKKEKK